MRVVLVAAACLLLAACSPAPVSSIHVQRHLVVVDNRSPDDWHQVEIWLNQQYRVTVATIAAGSRFSTTLDVFVAGFGQRFDPRRQRIDDLRLKAKTEDGTLVELGLGRP